MAHAVVNWLYHVLGLKGGGPWYAAWSGPVGDVTIVASILFGPLLYWHKHDCHEPRCLRIGKHPAAAGLYLLCSKHHPDIPAAGITHDHIRSAHQASVRVGAQDGA